MFAVSQTSGDMTAIEVIKGANSSTELVQKVARGEADLAAVWSGTKVKFDKEGPMHEEYGAKVLFIPLPTPLPNDLLVSSSKLTHGAKKQITDALGKMPERAIDKGDFLHWKPIHAAPPALDALASLKLLSAVRPAPVVVHVTAEPNAEEYLEDARHAVRLSGTELALFAPPFHTQPDVKWSLKRVHDGALVLLSQLQGHGLEGLAQRFQISFTSAPGDLTKRIVLLIHSRMHRLRYIWP